MEIEYAEGPNGFPLEGDIVVNHAKEQAYLVLPDINGTGTIETPSNLGDPCRTFLHMEE